MARRGSRHADTLILYATLPKPFMKHLLLPLLLSLISSLSGCAVVSVGSAVVSVAGTAVSIGAGAVGLAADAAIGTARLGGKAVGAVLPGGN